MYNRITYTLQDPSAQAIADANNASGASHLPATLAETVQRLSEASVQEIIRLSFGKVPGPSPAHFRDFLQSTPLQPRDPKPRFSSPPEHNV